jgi:hypothetical protein
VSQKVPIKPWAWSAQVFQDDCKDTDVIGDLAKAAAVFTVFAGLAGLGAPARAQQFTADILQTNAAQPLSAAGKIYVSGNKIRIETPDVRDGFFVVDAQIPASYFVRPSQHVFMDSRQSSQLTRLLVPVDLDDPCRQWQAMSAIAADNSQNGAWACQRVGHGAVGELDAIEYRASSPKGGTMRAWVDPQLKWPVKLSVADGTNIELRNIQEQPQPANLFEIPPGFRKFDPKALLERIKQSDVWVEPQH